MIKELKLDLADFASELFQIRQDNIPDDEDSLKNAVLAEIIRLAMDTKNLEVGENDWPTLHILSLRNWVKRKLQAVKPDISNRYQEVISNIVFTGDLIELSSGYYSPAPTRVVPIYENTWLLVSGLPTHYFNAAGYEVKITGLGRQISEKEGADVIKTSFQIQNREDYVGAFKFDWSYLKSILKKDDEIPWRRGKKESYQGNDGSYDFKWGLTRNPYQSTPLGTIGMYREKHEHNKTSYWLRDRREGSMINVPTKIFKHICLLLDQIQGDSRTIYFKRSKKSSTVEMSFPPPGAQLRWLYAIGAIWIGSKGGRIRWRISSETVPSTIEIFRKLPVEIKEEK